MKKVPVIIPARGGSKGIPRKNVLPVGGKPLITHAIEAALKADGVAGVWVSTDDDEIATVSEQYGASVITRPAELAGDTASSEVALLHALDFLEEQRLDFDVFCFMQCTSPLTASDDIARALARFAQTKADSLLSVTPNHRFLWRKGEKGYEGINHSASFRARRQELPPEYAENGAFYLMKKDGFRRAKHRFFGRIEILEMDPWTAVEIDEPSDLELVDYLLRQRSAREQAPRGASLSEIRAIVFDFDGVFTDDRVWVDENGKESAVCSRSDGMGIELLRNAFSGPILILSREQNPIVRHRAKKLKLDCLHGVGDKLTVLRDWANQQGIELSQIAYVGNDLNDAECLAAVGLGVVPSDAHREVRIYADLTLSYCGGRGAVREFCDRMLSQLKPANVS